MVAGLHSLLNRMSQVSEQVRAVYPVCFAFLSQYAELLPCPHVKQRQSKGCFQAGFDHHFIFPDIFYFLQSSHLSILIERM